MNDRRRRLAVVVGCCVAIVVSSACTAVPDSGPVRAGDQTAQPEPEHIQLQARLPVPGDPPANIVSDFQFANADIGSALGIAKAYLTDGASWQPRGVKVVGSSTLTATLQGDLATVNAVATQVGTIAPDGTFQPSPASETITYPYQLSKAGVEKGQWRITNPPPYLVLTVDQIESTYQKGYVYFLRPDEQMLVPVQVFLPVSRENFADTLLRTLLLGPPAWLQSAVTTAFPAHTVVTQPSTEVNGVTTVELSREVAAAPAAQRNAMAAQISYTLANSDTPLQDFGQLRVLSGSQLLVSCKGLPVQTAKDCSDFDGDAVPTDFYYSDLEHGTRDHFGHLVAGDTGVFGITSLLAPVLVPRRTTPSTPALIAGVVQGPGATQELYAGPLTEPKKLLGGSSFTTPSWDSLGNLWTVQQLTSSSTQQVRVAPTGKATLPGPVAAPELANKVIEELRVSRDGTRVAVLAVSTNASQVLVGAVTKDGAIINFYPVAPALTTATDFVWASSTQLDILATSPSSGGGTVSQLWNVDVDGWPPSLIEQSVPSNADSVTAAPGEPIVIGTTAEEIDIDQDGEWQFVSTGTAPHYPG